MLYVNENLPIPDLPQMLSGNVLIKNDLDIAGGIFVNINGYSNPAVGDSVYLLWDGDIVGERFVSDVSADFPMSFVITEGLSLGGHVISYYAKDAAENENSSDNLEVIIIDGAPESLYLPPVFINAVDGVISIDSIDHLNGTNVYIPDYDGISVGDEVIVFIKKSSENGEGIRTGIYQITIDNDYLSGVTVLIDADLVEVYGDGTISAYYVVFRNNERQGMSSKAEALVDISGSDGGDGLDMIISTNAAVTDYNAINLYPFNHGVIRGGTPGEKIVITVTGNATFSENDENTYSDRLDESGKINFKIYSHTQESVIVSAYGENSPEKIITKSVTFGPYSKGEGKISYINHSTGALADSVMPCSIYLKVVDNARSAFYTGSVTMVRVSVNGSAIIDSYGAQMADVILNSDLSAEIDIVNGVPESINVELSLPESSGSINRLLVVFVK